MSEQSANRDLRLIGSVIENRFLIIERLAAGGMGVVYRAEQQPLGRPVALKILETRHNEDLAAQFGERFVLEAGAVAKLSHPNTITLYDYGRTADDLYYYAMELVEGDTLSRYVYRNGPLSPAEAIHVGMQVCGSLREAHQAGMIHRDLKPGNIMLTELYDDPLFVKVLDFGLVKVMSEGEGIDLTQSGMLMGSPRYMAPEQVLGAPLDGRADIYSLGSVLYHALTGFPTFPDASQFEVLRAQVETTPRSFRQVNPACQASADLEDLIFRCMAKEPEGRPQSMQELAAELARCGREIGLELSLSGAGRQSVPAALRSIGAAAGGHAPLDPAAAPHASPNATGLPQPVAHGQGAGQGDISVVQRSGGPVAAAPHPAPAGAPIDPVAISGSHPGGVVPAATPARARSPWPLIAIGGLALTIPAVAFGVYAAMLRPEPAPTPEVAVPEPAVAAPVQAPAPTAEPEPEPPPLLGTVAMRVESEPTGARVRRGEIDLGDAPFSIEIPEGERWPLTFTLSGYETRTVEATSGRENLHVSLARTRRSGRRGNESPPAPQPQPVVRPVAATPAPAPPPPTPPTNRPPQPTTTTQAPNPNGPPRTDLRRPTFR